MSAAASKAAAKMALIKSWRRITRIPRVEVICSPAPADTLREVANNCTTKECTYFGDNNDPGSIL